MAWLFLKCLACVCFLTILAGCVETFEPPTGGGLDVRHQRPGGAVREVLALDSHEPLPGNPALEDYLRYAEAHNPGLKAAFERWQAAVERVPQARALPDPMATFQVDARAGFQGYTVGFEQMLPWFGKLSLKAQAAQLEADAAGCAYEAERLKLCYSVATDYYEYYYLARSVAIVRQQRDYLKRLEGVLSAGYAGGTSRYSDLLRAQVELGKMENEIQTLADMRGPMVGRLNADLNRPANLELPWPVQPSQQMEGIAEEDALERYRRANPELLALENEIAMRERGIALAEKEYYPDVKVGLDYMKAAKEGMFMMPSGMKDPVVLMLSVNLPIWREKLRAGVSQAEAERGEAVQMRADRENELAADIRMACYKLRDAKRRLDLYRDALMPKGRQSVEASEAAFRAGTGAFLDVVDAVRMLLEFELAYERAVADWGQRLAELDMLVGGSLLETTPAPPQATAPSPEQMGGGPK